MHSAMIELHPESSKCSAGNERVTAVRRMKLIFRQVLRGVSVGQVCDRKKVDEMRLMRRRLHLDFRA